MDSTSFTGQQLPALRAALASRPGPLVACLCAAWCRTCDGFKLEFDALAARHPQATMVWLDIEDDAELVDGLEVENFPTVLVQRGDQLLFFGTVLPRVSHIERLLDLPAPVASGAHDELPDLRARLLQGPPA